VRLHTSTKRPSVFETLSMERKLALHGRELTWPRSINGAERVINALCVFAYEIHHHAGAIKTCGRSHTRTHRAKQAAPAGEVTAAPTVYMQVELLTTKRVFQVLR
jgi:hypothetical protein